MKLTKILSVLSIGVIGFGVSLFISESFFSTQVDRKAITGTYGAVVTDGTNHYPSLIRLNKGNRFFCSGVVIDGQYALTAAHCVKNFIGKMNQDPIDITDVNDIDTGIKAIPVGVNGERDIALLKGDFRKFEAAAIDYDGATVGNLFGTPIINCGFPSGGFRYCSAGYVVGNEYFKLQAKGQMLFKGMSGGPVYGGSDLKVIGVNSAVADSYIIVGPILGSFEIFGISPRF